MSFHPDVVVMSPDRSDVELVAEFKAKPADLDLAEAQLKVYMTGMRSGLGLLVSRDEVRVFRDTFLSGDARVKEIARFETSDLLGHSLAPLTDREIEDEVWAWLELLAAGERTTPLSKKASDAVDALLAPVLVGGRVIAGRYH